MNETTMDVGKIREYWLVEAIEALRVAEHLVDKQDYSYALFFGHLAVEKILKALYVSHHREHAPPIHNLLRLARVAGLSPDEAKIDDLITITAFNIEARYPDLKRSFRLKCTPEFTNDQMQKIKEVFKWVRSQLP